VKTTIVKYKVKPQYAEENTALIKMVFEQVKRESPSGLRYCSFQLDDGVSFIHIAVLDDSLQENPLPGMSAFKEFTSRIADRCDEAPQAMSAKLVGAYATFGF